MNTSDQRHVVRRVIVAAVSTILFLGHPAVAQDRRDATGLPAVPTTRVLAIGHLGATGNAADLRPVMSEEVEQTVKLYLNGKISAWWVRKDQPGVVFILDVRDPAEARALLEDLPLGRKGLMTFELIPLGPLAPLGILLPKR